MPNITNLNKFTKNIEVLFSKNARNQEDIIQLNKYELAKENSSYKLVRGYYAKRINLLKNSFFQFTDQEHDLNTCTKALECLHYMLSLKNRPDFIRILNQDKYQRLLERPIDFGTSKDKKILSENLACIMKQLFADNDVKQLVKEAYTEVQNLNFHNKINNMQGTYEKMMTFAQSAFLLSTLIIIASSSLFMLSLAIAVIGIVVGVISLVIQDQYYKTESQALKLQKADNFLKKDLCT